MHSLSLGRKQINCGILGSFHRMKEDLEEMAMQVSAKLPGKTVI
jgi:hypothetical protein